MKGLNSLDWYKNAQREINEFSRLVLEAIQVRTKEPNLNKDNGLLILGPCLGHLASKEGRGK